jgi:hypothetical protein
MIELYAKTKYYITIYTGHVCTVIAQECDPDSVPEHKLRKVLYSGMAKHAKKIDIILELSHSGDNLYIYSCTHDGKIFPRIHTPHLELLRDIIISGANIDKYVYANIAPAAEIDIRYDEDDQ